MHRKDCIPIRRSCSRHQIAFGDTDTRIRPSHRVLHPVSKGQQKTANEMVETCKYFITHTRVPQ